MSDKKLTQQEIAPCDTGVDRNITVDSSASAAPAVLKKQGVFYSPRLTLRITLYAVFAALAVVVKIFTVSMVQIKLSFFYIPVYLSGVFLGPVAGFAIGFLGDLLGTFITGQTPYLLLCFGNALAGAIMGLVFKLKFEPAAKIILGALICLFVVTLGVNTLALMPIYKLSYFKMLLLSNPLPRILAQPIILIINLILILMLYHPIDLALKKIVPEKGSWF